MHHQVNHIEDSHCDGLKRNSAELEREIETLQLSQEYAEEIIPELVVLDNLPKILPASAKKETGGKAGTKSDINISLLNKKTGVSVDRAAEMIVESYGPEGEGLLPGYFDWFQVRNEVINILKMGKRNYRAQFITPVQEVKLELKEANETYKNECVGEVPTIDLSNLSFVAAKARALKIKYKYAA